MQHVLLTCADLSLRDACRQLVQERGLTMHWVATGESALRYIQQHVVDLVILHSDAADQDSFAILEVLRSFRPDVSIILTSSQFDYWNNFMTWLADECVVTTQDLGALGGKIDEQLGLRTTSTRSNEGAHFAVDWE